jgi:starch synthase
MLPHHGLIDDARHELFPLDKFDLAWNDSITRVEVATTTRDEVRFYFLRGWPFFAAEDKFVYSSNEGIDVGRYLFFAAAALELVRRIGEGEGWRPDVFHVHDWHIGTVPFLLSRVFNSDPVLGGAATLFSIHNMQYQGWGIGWHLHRAHLPIVEHSLLHAMGKVDNTLAIGLAYSTMLSTVSPRYAQEITTPEGGYGLDGLLHARQSRLVGILNGIDVKRWNPATSPHLSVPYDTASLGRRIENKVALQEELGLPIRADVPVVATVMRLVEQKGPAIMFPAVRYMLEHSDVQFVLLGSGQPHYENEAYWLGHDFPAKAAIRLGFDEVLSERIYAGSDIFLMPSQFEPCGIGQMLAMRYGSLPVVRQVGGLADTVSPDIGFLFTDYHPGALGWALGRALETYTTDPTGWRERQRRAMQRDFSWEGSAKKYIDLYQQTIAVRRSYT